MKKLYFLLFTVAPMLMIGQNLVVNPTFNDGLNGWTAGPSTSYTLPTIVAADGSDGSNSAQYIATATTGFYQEIAVTAGNQLTISFKYIATGDDTDARIWSNYKDAADVIIYQEALNTDDPLRNNNSYLDPATTWTQKTIVVTVPANAVKLVLAVRTYNGGTASFDEFSVVQVPLSVSQNAIAGLKVYPNPVSNGKLFIETAANAERTVAIYDLLGKNVLNKTTSNSEINVASLNAGDYIVKITEEGNTTSRKLVIR